MFLYLRIMLIKAANPVLPNYEKEKEINKKINAYLGANSIPKVQGPAFLFRICCTSQYWSELDLFLQEIRTAESDNSSSPKATGEKD
jgi:hypothetical protein